MNQHEIALDKTAKDAKQIRAALPEDLEMDKIARIFQAMADPTRCKIILALTRHELSVSEIGEVVGASTSAVSHHLKGLRDISVVKFRREGNTKYYSVDDEHVANLFREAIYHLDHVRRQLPDHQPLREVS